MLFDDLDWSEVYHRLHAWQALTPDARKAYAALRPSDYTPASDFGDDLATLVEAGFLVATAGVNVRIHPEAKPIVRAFRLMVRHPFLQRHDQATLVRYSTELLVGEERRELMATVEPRYAHHDRLAEHVASVDWPRRFATPQPHGEKYPEPSLSAARRLVAELLETPGPMRLRDLPRRLGDFDGDARWNAVNVAIANLAVFPVFLEEGPRLAEPGLTLWPPTARRHFAPPPRAPSERAPERSWAGGVLVQDAGAVLMAAAAEPLRIRQNDGAFYKRTAEDVADSLTSLPGWLVEAVRGLDSDSRLSRARQLLQDMGLVLYRELPGGRLGLVPAPGAQEWIALGPTRQLRLLVERWRVGEGFAVHESEELEDEFDLDFDDEFALDFEDDDVEFRSSIGGLDHFRSSFYLGYCGRLHGTVEDLATAIRDAVGRLDGRGFVGLHEFAEFEAAEHNPLESEAHDLRVRWGWGHDTVESLRRTWADELRAFVLNRLVLAEGVRVGLDGEGALVFEPTSVGRYLVGLAGTFQREVPDESGTVVVQPDFEVVFLGPAPETEGAVAGFAKRLGHGVGTLFRLTPEAAFGAAAAGLTAEGVLETLEAAAAQPIPPNVKHEIRAWFGRARRLSVRRTLVVDCGDPEVARRLSAAGGSDVRLLAETMVEIPAGKLGRRLTKRAAAKGLFLVPPGR